MESEKKWYQEMPVHQRIDARLSRGIADASPNLGADFGDILEGRVLEISGENGSTKQLADQAEKYLEMWRGFLNDLFARTDSKNLRSPETVDIAIEGARSLMSPEPTREGEEAARKMIKALQKRYGNSIRE